MIPQQRKDLYDRSDPVYPSARFEERQIMIDLLMIKPEHIVCDVPAWSGYLADGIRNLTDPAHLICVESSPRFAAGINKAYTVHCCQPTKLPLLSASVDRLGSMVGLHHLDDKLAFLREAVRVLKPGGRIAVSEVHADTPVARFLNGPVHAFTMNGHRGMFVRTGECGELLEAVGCTNVVERFCDLHWVFQSIEDMTIFCQGLLGMAKATENDVLDAITSHFDVKVVGGFVKLPWSLTYAVGDKA